MKIDLDGALINTKQCIDNESDKQAECKHFLGQLIHNIGIIYKVYCENDEKKSHNILGEFFGCYCVEPQENNTVPDNNDYLKEDEEQDYCCNCKYCKGKDYD